MIKALRNYVNVKLADWMAIYHPDFRKVKLKLSGTAYAGCNVFFKQANEKKKAWIVVGGDADSASLVALLCWSIDGYDWGKDWEKFDRWTETSHPSTGFVQLTDSVLVGDDLPLDGARLLCVADPSMELQNFALSEWKKTEIYRKSRELTATKMRAQNPQVTDEEIDQKKEKGLRALYSTWSAIADVVSLDDEILGKAVDPLLNSKLYYLLEKYGFEFLDKKLSTLIAD